MVENLDELEEKIKGCNRCKLCKTRQNIVFGVGNKNAKIMFIGEGPGADEDRLGEPFVGKAGKLMDMAFEAVGIKRQEVYIANIVKCRPPANRNPEDDEAAACMDYLITASRGKVIEKKQITYIPTWHPAALLRDETKKIDFINDLKLVLSVLNKIEK